jgi:hypothetical protein
MDLPLHLRALYIFRNQLALVYFKLSETYLKCSGHRVLGFRLVLNNAALGVRDPALLI